MVNLSDLKLKEIRKSIDVDISGEIQEINIFNPNTEQREEIKNKIQKLTEEGKEISVLIEDVFNDMFSELTNIVVDENIIDVLNAPTGNMLIVMQEVFEIIREVQLEVAMVNYQNLCQLESLKYNELSLLKAQHVDLISKDVEKVQGEIDNFNKNIKK
ncbi:MAG: hypothetical protein E6356_17240 [Terrisporobacter othiniensis]|nr:hypothetical protein [Terrisporobacter othiniensis]